MLSGLASSTRAISVSFDKQATTTDKVQAGISGIISLTNMVISAANQRNAKEKEYQQNAIAFEHEYKVLLNERLGTQTQLNENVFVKDYQGRLTDSFKMFSDASSKYKQALGELSKGQAKIGLQNTVNLGNVGLGVCRCSCWCSNWSISRISSTCCWNYHRSWCWRTNWHFRRKNKRRYIRRASKALSRLN
jgi:hypothetical protein